MSERESKFWFQVAIMLAVAVCLMWITGCSLPKKKQTYLMGFIPTKIVLWGEVDE